MIDARFRDTLFYLARFFVAHEKRRGLKNVRIDRCLNVFLYQLSQCRVVGIVRETLHVQSDLLSALRDELGRYLGVHPCVKRVEHRPELTLRGGDLRDVHERAIARLNAVGLSTTFVMTVRRGVNDGEIGDVLPVMNTAPWPAKATNALVGDVPGAGPVRMPPPLSTVNDDVSAPPCDNEPVEPVAAATIA